MRQVDAIYLDVPPEECLRRISQRKDHPTLSGGPESVTVVSDFARIFQAPARNEGFANVYAGL